MQQKTHKVGSLDATVSNTNSTTTNTKIKTKQTNSGQEHKQNTKPEAKPIDTVFTTPSKSKLKTRKKSIKKRIPIANNQLLRSVSTVVDSGISILKKSEDGILVERDNSIGIDVLQNINQLWLDYSYNHSGSALPSPYEFDVFDSRNKRIMQVLPIYTTSGVFEREKHTIGKPAKGFSVPNELSCRSLHGQAVCNIIFATTKAKPFCKPSFPQLKLNVFVQGIEVGLVSQSLQTINIKADLVDTNLMTIKGVPAPSGRCGRRRHPEFASTITIHSHDNDNQIGVFGRNGIIQNTIVMGNALRFYCDFSMIETDENTNKLCTNLHRILLLAVTVGFMTLCKC